MPEVLTCSCGNQEWVIRETAFECGRCSREYRMSAITSPRIQALRIDIMNGAIKAIEKSKVGV